MRRLKGKGIEDVSGVDNGQEPWGIGSASFTLTPENAAKVFEILQEKFFQWVESHAGVATGDEKEEAVSEY